MKAQNVSSGWDLCAVTLSSLCMLHCLGLPIVAAFLPVLSLSIDNHLLHIVMVLLAAPVTLWVVWHEYGHRGFSLFIALALIGLSMMLAAVTMVSVEVLEVAFTLSGGVLLAGAHVLRWSQLRAL